MTSQASGGPAGRAGLALTAVSIVTTFTVAVLGPSVMEPALPGRGGQPPWAVDALPSPYLVVALTAFAIAAGTAGLALTLRATRRGWTVSPWIILAAGVAAAAALAFVPPFGTSDHLSYAAYGRMVVTGHNPYTTTPAALARLGDPVARAVQDWRTSPSVYGSLATGAQAFASMIGGTSVRLTIFVLSWLNVAAFAVTGLLLHWMARGDPARQLRAALLWTCNPLLLQVLIAGAHVDSQAVVCVVGALAVFSLGTVPGSRSQPGPAPGSVPGSRPRSAAGSRPASATRQALAAAGAGGLIGAGFAVKATTALAGAGLAIGCVLAWHTRRRPEPGNGRRQLALVLGCLAAGFCVTAGASLARWGLGTLTPALREGSYVSIGSPWRAVRAALGLATGDSVAEDLVKAGAVVLAMVLLALLLRSISAASPGSWPQVHGLADASADLSGGRRGSAGPAVVPVTGSFAVAASFAVVFAWLVAWPYVLPWYDGLGWALLALLPFSRLDWLMLARTAALAFGYLPGRTVLMPTGLGWLRTVVRTGVTPVVLLAVTVALVIMLWPRRAAPVAAPSDGNPDGSAEGALRSQSGRLTS
jgi:hypothetical protein